MKRFLSHLRFLNWRVARRMAWNLILVRIFRQRRLRNVQLAVTYRCNHKCNMCSSSELYDRDRKALTLNQWKDVCDQLYDLGCTHFDITGGEPTIKGLRFLCSLITHLNRRNNCIVSLATNGTKVNTRWLQMLYDSGLNSLLLDIQPGNHDEIVGRRGSLRHVRTLINEARAIGLNVCINTCLGSYNIEEFEELVKWASEKNLHVLTNLAAPTGKLEGKAVRLTDFKKRYYDLLRKYKIMRSDTTYNYFGLNRCPGGREKVYITCYGDTIQCTFVQVSYGNVLNQPLKSIYSRFWTNSLIRKKYICKHTFMPEFQQWMDVMTKGKKLPVDYEQFQKEAL